MTKTFRKIFYIIAFMLLLGAFIYLGNQEYNIEKKQLTDAEKFNLEYPEVSTNNPFKYVDSSEALDILQNKTGYIFMGYSKDIWSQKFAKYLSEVANDKDIETIYYYDLLKDRSEMTKIFKSILEETKDYLVNTDGGDSYLFVPNLFVVKDGIIIYENDESALVKGDIKPDEYWTADKIIEFKNTLYENLNLEGEIYDAI